MKVKLVLEVEDNHGPGALLALFKIARHVVVDFGNSDFIEITRAELVYEDGEVEELGVDLANEGATLAEVFGHKR